MKKAEQEKVDLIVFLETIRKCVDLQELTPTIVNTLIKRIEANNSTKDKNGRKHVPIEIYFTAVCVIDISASNKIVAAVEKIISNADQYA